MELVEGRLVARLPKTFGGRAVQPMLQEIRQAVQQDARDVVVDFTDTTFIDSSGIGSLVVVAKELATVGRSLIVRNLNDATRELFEMTGVDQVFAQETAGGMRGPELDFAAGSVDIKLDIQQDEAGDVGILRLAGVMNHPQGSQFFKTRFLLLLAKHKKILLDMEDLTFLDSVSVGVVMSMYKLTSETGGSIRICSPNYIVYDLLSTLNIDKTVAFFDQRAQALENWQ